MAGPGGLLAACLRHQPAACGHNRRGGRPARTRVQRSANDGTNRRSGRDTGHPRPYRDHLRSHRRACRRVGPASFVDFADRRRDAAGRLRCLGTPRAHARGDAERVRLGSVHRGQRCYLCHLRRAWRRTVPAPDRAAAGVGLHGRAAAGVGLHGAGGGDLPATGDRHHVSRCRPPPVRSPPASDRGRR